MNIIYSSVPIKSEPTDSSPLETEGLYGETVEILDENLDWLYCKLNTDNYYGWIKKKALGVLNSPTHRVFVKRTFVFLEKNTKSNSLFYLPMGARLVVESIKSDWAKIILSNNNIKTGYVPSNHLVCLNHRVKDWVAIAELLDGIPYKWGGRDTLGIDCSALLQLAYQTYGQSIPRNSSEQIKLKKKTPKKLMI